MSTTSGTRSVMSARFRVYARTSSPSRCTWMRAPSSFHSTAAVPVRSSALADRSRLREHGLDRAEQSEPELVEPGRPFCQRLRRNCGQVAGEHDGAAHVRDGYLRCSRDGVDDHTLERALPEPPEQQTRQESLLASVARENSVASSSRRFACEPGPEVAAMRDIAASTSTSASVGVVAGSGRSRSAAQPTPIEPGGNTPERYATATPTSPLSAAEKHSASLATFARREDVSAMSADVAATSAKSTWTTLHAFGAFQGETLIGTNSETDSTATDAYGGVCSTSSSRPIPPDTARTTTGPTPRA